MLLHALTEHVLAHVILIAYILVKEVAIMIVERLAKDHAMIPACIHVPGIVSDHALVLLWGHLLHHLLPRQLLVKAAITLALILAKMVAKQLAKTVVILRAREDVKEAVLQDVREVVNLLARILVIRDVKDLAIQDVKVLVKMDVLVVREVVAEVVLHLVTAVVRQPASIPVKALVLERACMHVRHISHFTTINDV